jgi:type I restriction enzyme, S subunit
MSEDRTKDWDTKRLNEIFRLQTKSVFPAAHPEREFLHHSIPAYDETEGPNRELGRQIESSKTVVGRPSILVSKLNPRIPRVSLVKEVSSNEFHCSSTEFMVYEPVSNLVDLGYFYRVFSSEDFRRRLTATATGTTGSRTRAHPRETLHWEVRVPPLAEQRKIAEIMDTLDEAIRSTERLIAKLEKAKRGLIHALLTSGLDEFGRVRDPGRDSAVFHATSLGVLPSAWKVASLHEVSLKITDGTHQSVVATEHDSEAVPFLYVSCIGDNEIRWSRAGRISSDCYKRISQGRVPAAGMVLYTAVGSYGHAAVVQESLEFAFQRHIACIYPDTSQIEPAFMAIWLNGELAKDISDRIAIGNAQKTVTLGALADFPIPVPSKDEQIRLLAAAKPSDELRFSELSNLAKLRELKRGLADDLLSGRVHINAGDRRLA